MLRAGVQAVASSTRQHTVDAKAPNNVSSRGRCLGLPPPEHLNPLQETLAIRQRPLQVLNYTPGIVFPFMCVRSAKLPFCHFVSWDNLHVHGLCHREKCEVDICLPPAGTSGVFKPIERQWRCVQHFLFSCKASPIGCPDPNDLWMDILQTLPSHAHARAAVHKSVHANPFCHKTVREVCVPWVLDPGAFLSDCPASVRAQVFSLVAAYILLIGAFVGKDVVSPAQSAPPVQLARSSLRDLSLPPWSRVVRRFRVLSHPSRGAEAEAHSGYGGVPD